MQPVPTLIGLRPLLTGCALLWGICSSCLQIHAQEVSVAELVRQLSSPSFQERERATVALIERGNAAIAPLRQITKQNLEASFRAEAIVAKLESRRFDEASRRFLLESESPDPNILPGWDYFSGVAGDSRTAKLMFLEVLRAQPKVAKLLQEYSAQPTEANSKIVGLAAENLAISLINQRSVRSILPEIGDVAAVLIATSVVEGQAPVAINEFLVHSSYSIPVTTYMSRQGYNKVLRSLYAPWIPKTHDALAYDVLFLAMRDDHATGAELARRYVGDNFDVRLRESAIQCLARFGKVSDLSLLAPLLNDDEVCGQFDAHEFPSYLLTEIEETEEFPPGVPVPSLPSPNPEEAEAKYQYRVQDLALAASMMIADEDLTQVFPQSVAHEKFGFDRRHIATRNTKEAREKRLEQIRLWKEKLETRKIAPEQ